MMKSLFFMVGLVSIPLAVLSADEGTSMKDILSTMSAYVNYLEDSLSQEIVHLQADIITEDGRTFTRTLYEGWTYGIAAFGDWRIADLDIIVYKDVDGEWIEITKDNEIDNHPAVEIKPTSTAAYMIHLQVYSFKEDYTSAHYGMLIFHERP